MKKTDETRTIIGRVGEKIVGNMLRKLGHQVEETLDNFDSTKDLIVDNNIHIEVKTQQPYVMTNSLTFKDTQLRKCKSVDVLFFVTVPPLIDKKYKWGGWILKVDPKNFKYSTYKTKKGTSMIAIPIEQEYVKPIRKLTDEELSYIEPYLSSEYIR